MTGLSGAGKSTLVQRLEKRLIRAGILAAALDDDFLRTGLRRSPGFSTEDRRENIYRVGELALHGESSLFVRACKKNDGVHPD